MLENANSFDVIILGGGAAGLMCAAAAGARGRRVLVLEGSKRVGRKILMSGGGRCNFTNLYCEPENFISANSRFCISALSRYTQWDFIALVEAHGIDYCERSLGQLFCVDSARDILAMLERECQQAGVEILTNAEITSVSRGARADDSADGSAFEVVSHGRSYTCESLVIATGGLSIPTMGASDFGYRLAEKFGLRILERQPGLVPFTFSGAMHDLTVRLSGLGVPVVLSTGAQGASFAEAVLFTHRGLSGPAALQLSSYWRPGTDIHIDLLPEQDAAAMLLQAKAAQPKSLLRTFLSGVLPRALVLELQQLLWPESAEKRLAELTDDVLRNLGAQLQHWTLTPAGTEGYRTAEVTLGGIDTDELSSRTMECKRQPDLYCIGEVVDVTGHLGGFNFQWAWSSAQAAGQVV